MSRCPLGQYLARNFSNYASLTHPAGAYMQSFSAARPNNLRSALAHSAIHSPLRSVACKSEELDRIGTDVPFARNAQVYGEGEPSTCLYKIMSGLARCYRMSPDGRRQIVAFYLPGDLFGFEIADHHTLSVEAVVDSRLCIVRKSALVIAMSRDDETSHELWLNISREIGRGQDHILQFGKPAQARVASFLLEMAQRVPNSGARTLAISRQDIADYLDLRIETVSRAMTRLAQAGAIAPSSRRSVTIRNSEILHQIAD